LETIMTHYLYNEKEAICVTNVLVYLRVTLLCRIDVILTQAFEPLRGC
jgi:hypothetical protein